MSIQNKCEANVLDTLVLRFTNNVKKGEQIMSKFYTCDEIAEMFSVKLITVWDWIRKGKLKAYKIGKMYRIDQNQIDEFVSLKATNQQH